MKRAAAILAALAALTFGASAELMLEGSVVCGPSDAQAADLGGAVSEVFVQPGDYVRAGDPVAALSLTAVYAPCAGTVEAVFAQAGESASDATTRYGGALTIAPESQYAVYATSDDAYRSVRTAHVVPGQTVYMKCTRDGSHRGVGVVTETDGELIFIEATGGGFYNGEVVNVYMEPGYKNVDRIARGTVLSTAVETVAASGDVREVYVLPGDFVEKGQLLMETLDALDDNGEAQDCLLTAEAEGYVTAVAAEVGGTIERGGLLMSYCPADRLLASALVPESEVSAARVGAAAGVSVELDGETVRFAGAVEGVSYLPETTADGETAYRVLVALPADARLYPGMTAEVTIR